MYIKSYISVLSLLTFPAFAVINGEGEGEQPMVISPRAPGLEAQQQVLNKKRKREDSTAAYPLCKCKFTHWSRPVIQEILHREGITDSQKAKLLKEETGHQLSSEAVGAARRRYFASQNKTAVTKRLAELGISEEEISRCVKQYVDQQKVRHESDLNPGILYTNLAGNRANWSHPHLKILLHSQSYTNLDIIGTISEQSGLVVTSVSVNAARSRLLRRVRKQVLENLLAHTLEQQEGGVVQMQISNSVTPAPAPTPVVSENPSVASHLLPSLEEFEQLFRVEADVAQDLELNLTPMMNSELGGVDTTPSVGSMQSLRVDIPLHILADSLAGPTTPLSARQWPSPMALGSPPYSTLSSEAKILFAGLGSPVRKKQRNIIGEVNPRGEVE